METMERTLPFVVQWEESLHISSDTGTPVESFEFALGGGMAPVKWGELLASAGVGPAQPRKAGEVRVGRVQNVPTLDCQRGEMRICSQISCCAQPFESFAQLSEVSHRRMRNMDMWEIEPSLDAAQYVHDD